MYALLGLLLFGASIRSVFLAFNISDSFAIDGALAWAISALLVGYTLRDRLVAFVSIVLLTFWVSLGSSQRDIARSVLFPTIMTGAALPLVLSLRSRFAAVQWVLPILWWLSTLLLPGSKVPGEVLFAGATQVFLLFLYEIVSAEPAHVRRAGLGPLIRTVSAAGVLLMTYTLTLSGAEESVGDLQTCRPIAQLLP